MPRLEYCNLGKLVPTFLKNYTFTYVNFVLCTSLVKLN